MFWEVVHLVHVVWWNLSLFWEQISLVAVSDDRLKWRQYCCVYVLFIQKCIHFKILNNQCNWLVRMVHNLTKNIFYLTVSKRTWEMFSGCEIGTVALICIVLGVLFTDTGVSNVEMGGTANFLSLKIPSFCKVDFITEMLYWIWNWNCSSKYKIIKDNCIKLIVLIVAKYLCSCENWLTEITWALLSVDGARVYPPVGTGTSGGGPVLMVVALVTGRAPWCCGLSTTSSLWGEGPLLLRSLEPFWKLDGPESNFQKLKSRTLHNMGLNSIRDEFCKRATHIWHQLAILIYVNAWCHWWYQITSVSSSRQ